MSAQQPTVPSPPSPIGAPPPPQLLPATPAIAGVPLPIAGVPRTAQELRDLRARRSELSDQLTSAVGRRNQIAQRIRNADGADRVGLEQRLQILDQRIVQLETDIAITGQQVAAAPMNLLARSSTTSLPRGGPPFRERGAVAIGILFTLFVLAPLAFAAARSMWRRATHGAPPRDTETAQRLMRLETAVDTIAVEIERVAEGQRFLTRILAESNGAARMEGLAPARAADPVLAASTADIPLDRR